MSNENSPEKGTDSEKSVRVFPDTERLLNEDQMVEPTRINLLQVFGSNPAELAKLPPELLIDKK